MRQGPIVVAGSANVDFTMQLARLPTVGETATGGVFLQTYGGKGANQAVAAARAGGRVVFLGSLGDDVYGHAIRSGLHADGIDTTPTVMHPGTPTGSALVMFDRQGDNYLAVAPGANYALRPAHIAERLSWIDGAAMLVMQLEIPTETTEYLLARAAERGVPVLLNFAPALTREVAVDARMTCLVVNEIEAQALCGFPVCGAAEAEEAAMMLQARGPRFVVVTVGSQGCFACSGSFHGHIPAFAVTPVDTTAAGDVFCGALAVAQVEGRPDGEAVRFAAGAAALSVTRAGARPSIPIRAEIEGFLKERPL